MTPVPENKSKQLRPVKSCPSQLNTVCLTRSGVGRKPSASGNLIKRLRHSPALIRIVFSFFSVTFAKIESKPL
jgi:hypothetical protein